MKLPTGKAIAALAALALAACAWSGTAQAKRDRATVDIEIDLVVEVGEPVMIAGENQKAFIKITLVGFELADEKDRAPVNLAVVLDRSSSMSGQKFQRAKEAALMVVDRLGKNDIISIITYDSTVEVLVPATKVSNRDAIREKIEGLSPRGSTALFSGVSHGIEEVSKFLSDERVNRIILLSDGQANVGPSSPNALGRLGAQAGKQGIAITTLGIGLGYNEDLMTQLALRSDGNHAFVENADQLATFFNYELGDVLSVVAQDIDITIEFDEGIKPLRVLNREADIHGRTATFSIGQLVSKQQRYFIIEAEVDATKAGKKRNLADVEVSYANMVTNKKQRLRDSASVRFSKSKRSVTKHENKDVMVAAAEFLALKNSRKAVALRDEGKADEAERLLLDNVAQLEKQSKRYKSKRLEIYAKKNKDRAKAVQKPAKAWNKSRKTMSMEDYSLENNTTY